MKKYYLNIKANLIILVSVLILGSCTDDFEKINQDPNAATEEELGYDNLGVGSLITQIQYQIFPCVTKDQNVDVNNYQKMLSLAGDVYSGHQGASNKFDNNGSNNTTYNMTPDWYSVAYNLGYQHYMTPWYNLFQKKTISPEAFAVGLIMKVYGMHRITDMYGPIPYKDFVPASVVPFTSQDVVYDTFFAELDEAVVILEDYIKKNPTGRSLKEYDKIYESDFNKWILFANSLKLRLAIRIVYADEAKAKQKAEEAIKAGVLASNEDNAIIRVNGTSTVNPLYMISDSYGDTRLGATMESYLKGYEDPRLELLFKASELSNKKDYNGVRSGIDIKGDEYKVFSMLNVTAGTPIQIMTAAEVYFLRAEAALRNWNAGGTARSLYEEGIRTAFAQPMGASQGNAGDAENYIKGNSLPISYKDIVTSGNSYSEVGQVSVAWDESVGKDRLLEKIITQKWIALYPDGQEAWSEFRRTGCPRVIPVKENKGNNIIDTERQIARLPYPNSLSGDYPELYPEALKLLGGLDTGGTKLWWDKRTDKPYQK
ncbi:SusD/RagB family nutrient-binding outer membrane lipoprotein [Dysgonomonas massiliensis]|uniref:SusD/RagB family nutrient-binding outer membrane lipoprotein n=1 Tax=Dysgonomonas massiliensis TaxID=2040292 RepID=UPI000C7681F3|nr:SusD/RagB family nutrient-binding outer membrane lipoprotein [Dysgonomonas massiliensis]